MKSGLTTQEARDYFKKSGLSYAVLNDFRLSILRNKIDRNLIYHNKTLEGNWIKIKPERKNDVRTDGGKVIFYNIALKGSWFKERQGITFEEGGFIGFAGWASSVNVEPFISAFIEWCDWMRTEVFK